MAEERDKKGRLLKGVRISPKTEFKKGYTPWNKGLKKKKICLYCGKEFVGKKHEVISRRKFCSRECSGLYYGKQTSERFSGENNYNWIEDRTQLAKHQERNDSAYSNWVNEVKKRDNNKCRINNEDCSGYNIVHHILSWRDFPELRYNINNGITLCQAH